MTVGRYSLYEYAASLKNYSAISENRASAPTEAQYDDIISELRALNDPQVKV